MTRPAILVLRAFARGRAWCMGAAAAAGLLAGPAAHAQFAQAPPLRVSAPEHISTAQSPRDYRRDGARHLYAAYADHIYQGKLPPLLYGIAIVETEIDADGQVVDVTMVRPPAAPEVGPWVMAMVRKVGRFPPPSRLGRVKYLDIWLVHRSGRFQLDTLTEGQL